MDREALFKYRLEPLLKKSGLDLTRLQTDMSALGEQIGELDRLITGLSDAIKNAGDDINGKPADPLGIAMREAFEIYARYKQGLATEKEEEKQKLQGKHDALLNEFIEAKTWQKGLERHKAKKQSVHVQEQQRFQYAKLDELWLSRRRNK